MYMVLPPFQWLQGEFRLVDSVKFRLDNLQMNLRNKGKKRSNLQLFSRDYGNVHPCTLKKTSMLNQQTDMYGKPTDMCIIRNIMSNVKTRQNQIMAHHKI